MSQKMFNPSGNQGNTSLVNILFESSPCIPIGIYIEAKVCLHQATLSQIGVIFILD